MVSDGGLQGVSMRRREREGGDDFCGFMRLFFN